MKRLGGYVMRAMLQYLSATIPNDDEFIVQVKRVAAQEGIPLINGNWQTPKAQAFFTIMQELWQQRHPMMLVEPAKRGGVTRP